MRAAVSKVESVESQRQQSSGRQETSGGATAILKLSYLTPVWSRLISVPDSSRCLDSSSTRAV
jgi:hypothetical protein